MSTTTQPLWKPGTKNHGLEFANWTRLEKENPSVLLLLKQEAGFETEDKEYSFKVYHNDYGYSVGRRKKDASAPAAPQPRTKEEDFTLEELQMLRKLAQALKSVGFG